MTQYEQQDKWFKLCKILTIYCIIFSLIPCVFGSIYLGFEIMGTLKRTRYQFDEVATVENYQYTLWSHGKKVLIHIKAVPENQSVSLYKAIEAGYDGTNFYCVKTFNPDFDGIAPLKNIIRSIENKIKDGKTMSPDDYKKYEPVMKAIGRDIANRQKQKKNEIPSNKAVGYVTPHDYPESPQSDSVLNVVWLAYCSHLFLGEKPSGDLALPMICPTADLVRTREMPFAKVLRNNQFPGLPIQADYLHKGVGWEVNTNGIKEVILPPPFDKGYTNVTYLAGGFKKVPGEAFPLFYTLKMFTPLRQQGKFMAMLQRLEIIEGKSSTIKETCDMDKFIPDIKEETLVTDLRNPIANSRDSQYYAKPGLWNQSQVTKESYIKKREQEHGEKINLVKKVVVTCIVVVTIATVAITFKTKLRIKTK